MKTRIKQILAAALTLCMLICAMGVPLSVFAETTVVNVLFNNLDSTDRQDMEPATDATIKSLTLSTNCLEGTGAVSFGYKADKSSGGLYWYGRVPADYNTTGLDITGATHMIFDLYVSDVNGWTLAGDSRIALRSLASAQGVGTWDTSCGQVTSDTLNQAFAGLKNGWNRMVLPLDTSVATETVIWGYRMYFASGTAKAGFYMMMDDVRFVNQAYLDSQDYADVCAAKDVAMEIAALPAAREITAAHKTAVEAARASYTALDDTLKAKVTNLATLEAAEAALANAGQKLDMQIDGLDTNSLVILPAGNTGTNYPKGTITADNYTEGTGSLFSNWPAPDSGNLTGTQNGINISLVGVGGDSGLDFSAATYLSFDMYVHGFTMTEGKTAYVGFGSEAKWQSSNLGTVDFTDEMLAVKEGWNHFTLPIDISATAVKNIRMALDNGCTAVTLTAEDAYVLLDDVRLLNNEGKVINDVRNQAKDVIAVIAMANKSGVREEAIAARTAYDALSDAAKEYVTNLSVLEALEASVNIQFRSLDAATDVNGGNGTQTRSTETNNYLEGTGATKWQYTSDASGLFWYVYCEDHDNNQGVDITGAEYITFDIYVSDASAWTLAGDTRINFRDTSSGWNSVCGQVLAADMNSTFKALKTGWNHVVLPLDLSSATGSMVWAFRMYFASGTAPSGFYTIIDDIRFVSKAYLNSQQYTDTIAGKDVAAKICGLNGNSSAEEIYAVQSAYLALNEEAKKAVANVNTLNTLVESISGQPVDIQFRSLDSAERTAQEAATSTQTTTMRVEGTGAAKFEHAVARSGLYWYVYSDASVINTGVNIAGATHMIFDFYVNDMSLWDLGTGGSMAIYVRNTGSASWDNSCTEVKDADMRAAFAGVKQGWNHIALPIGTLKTTDAWGFRIHMTGASAQQGFYSIIDDVRFVNNAYLATDEYADKLAAKAVSGMISELTEDSDAAALTAARTAYDGLTDAQKGYVANYDWLTTFEAGGSLPGNTPQSFQTVPASHLADLANYEKGDFSLAILNDLHYAVNYNSQQKDVYLNSMQYILDRAEEENTLMTIQLGDLTSGNALSQWQTVREGFQMLVDGKMPYATVIGNHDIGGGDNAAYNAFLPYSEQVSENPYLAGAKAQGKTENLYYTFEVSGVKYMVLTLTCYPKDDVLTWADGVVKAHPDHNVILVTHSYLQVRSGTLTYTEETEALAAGFKGITVWEKLVKTNPNIFMTFSAHNSYPTPGQNGVGLMKATNDAGKTVYQFLVPDPQGYEATYGGLGNLFMLRFSNDGKTVTGEYIATRYNKDFVGYGTNNYEITLDPIVSEPDYAAMAAEVDEKIQAIGKVDGAKETAISEAQAAVDALPEQAKDLLTKTDVLAAAKDALVFAKRVEALPLPEDFTLEDETALQEAKTVYGALSEQSISMLTDEVLAKWDAIKDVSPIPPVDMGQLAAAADAKIEAIGTVDSSKEAAINEAQAAVDALPEAAKELLTMGDVLTAAKEALQVAKAIDALPDDPAQSNLSAEEMAAITAAYEGLSEQASGALTGAVKTKYEVYVAYYASKADVDYGDVNGDGFIDAKDALMVLQFAVDKITLTQEQQLIADVNGDKAIDAKDALMVLQKSVDKLDKFPVEQ